MENMASAIRRHNSKILRPRTQETDKQCSCRKDACPLEYTCLTRSLVYKSEVNTPENDPKVYIGMTSTTLNRFNGYTSSIKHRNHAKSTELSKHIWKWKDESTKFEIKCSVVKRVNAFKAGSKICNLCLPEKLWIPNFKNKNSNKQQIFIIPFINTNINVHYRVALLGRQWSV